MKELTQAYLQRDDEMDKVKEMLNTCALGWKQCTAETRILQMISRAQLDSLTTRRSVNLEVERDRMAQPCIMRCILSNAADVDKVAALSNEARVKAFHDAGGAWQSVGAAVHQEGKTLLSLYVDSKDAVQGLQGQEGKISEILGLSGKCKATWQKYLVRVLSHNQDKNSLPRPNFNLSFWSQKNGVSILNAFWSFGNLIFEIGSLEDAIKICRKHNVMYNGVCKVV